MIFSYPKGESQLPLSARVVNAEQQLHHREGVLRTHAATLVDDVRNRVTSPTGLLFAAGLGYLIAEALSRRTGAPPSPSQPTTEPGAAVKPSALESALHGLTSLFLFARPFIATYIEEKVRQHVHAGENVSEGSVPPAAT
jgi:hypothetical protein